MAEVNKSCIQLQVKVVQDNHLRFIQQIFDNAKEFELDDPTDEGEDYFKFFSPKGNESAKKDFIGNHNDDDESDDKYNYNSNVFFK